MHTTSREGKEKTKRMRAKLRQGMRAGGSKDEDEGKGESEGEG